MSTKTRALVSTLCLAAFATAASACGGAAPEPRAPAAQSEKAAEPEPQTIEQAQAQIERARAQLEGPAAVGAGGEAGSAAAPTVESTAPTGGASAPAREESFAGESGCATACRAIDSMRRAVDALCRLAGEQDARCTDARRTLAGSQAKVSACGCATP